MRPSTALSLPRTEERAHPPDAEPRSNPVAWVVDNDAATRAMVASCLRRSGLHVQEYSDGASAERALFGVREIGGHREKPVLVVIDELVTGAAGAALAGMIRDADWGTSVVLMTAFADDTTWHQAERAGVATVLDKPFDVRVLIDLGRQVVARRSSHQQLSSSTV